MKEIKFESLAPNVIVDDANKAVEFYTNLLGFRLVASVPETGTFNWAMVQRDGVVIMFQTLASIQEDLPSLRIEKKGSLGTFFIRVANLEEYYKQLKGTVEIADDFRTTFYGMKEFTVKDLNGYFLTFAEEAGGGTA